MLCPACKESQSHKVMNTKSKEKVTMRPCMCDKCFALFHTFEFALEGEEGRELYKKYVETEKVL